MQTTLTTLLENGSQKVPAILPPAALMTFKKNQDLSELLRASKMVIAK